MTRPESYVGVSGVVNYKNIQPDGQVIHEPQQLFIEAAANKLGFTRTNRLLALGVKATHKTQFLDVENKYGGDWYPVGDQDFADALDDKSKHPQTLGTAQIYLDVKYAGDENYRHEFMRRTIQRGRAWLRALQFDMLPWHNDTAGIPRFLGQLKDQHPDLQILLQAHGPAMEQLGPSGLARHLGQQYAGLADYVLFDSSHGTGKRMNTARLRPFLDEAYTDDRLANMGFAVAGGLNAANVQSDLPALLCKYPGLSWDAEGQLHPLNNAGKRPLNIDWVRDYLQASADALDGSQKAPNKVSGD